MIQMVQKKKIKELIRYANSVLQKVSHSPILDAELLLSYILQIERNNLFFLYEDFITGDQYLEFLILLKKRENGISVAHILGKKSFFLYEFVLLEKTLMPRPESELVIEIILKLYKNNRNKIFKFADFGTGSGCLIVSILKEFPFSKAIGFENSRNAFLNTEVNLKKYNVVRRAKMFFRSWEYCISKLDIIIANPPYIPTRELFKLQDEVYKNEDINALNGGASGYKWYFKLPFILNRCLKLNGFAIVEIGANQGLFLRQYFIHHGFKVSIFKDLYQNDRCLMLH